MTAGGAACSDVILIGFLLLVFLLLEVDDVKPRMTFRC